MSKPKNIVITGTSRGIGFELVKICAASGHRVLALSRNTQPVAALRHTHIHFFPFDVGKAEDTHKLSEFLNDRWKHVDILINNAGALIRKPFSETSPEEFEAVYRVNVLGLAGVIRTILPFMPEDGHVVNISSMGGIQGSIKFPGLAAYSSAKGAVISLTEILAEEYRKTGPSFNALALGAVQTEMLEAAFPGYKAPVTAKEMAEYIYTFALKGHRFYNGKILEVSRSTP
ncbi:MAG: SDR family oxidoreductase [Sinomicrobium sp.]|nr:SDR family oxidoreductase [Sinomicrobium sp.]